MKNIDLEKQLTKVQDWVKSVDNKNSIFLALALGVTVIFISLTPKVNSKFIDYNLLLKFLPLVIALFLIMWSLTKALLLLKPQINNHKSNSISFFGDISKLTLEEYESRVKKAREKDITSDLIQQIHMSSSIASKKHTILSEAIWLFLIGIIFWIIYIATTGVK